MPSQFIGMIIGTTTRQVYAVLNPDDDSELDNPRHLLLQNEEKEPVKMVKVDRADYGDCTTPDDLGLLINKYYVLSSFVAEGEEHIDAVDPHTIDSSMFRYQSRNTDLTPSVKEENDE